MLEDEIRVLLNLHSADNESNTPDYILASYLMAVLDAFNDAVRQRTEWHRTDAPHRADKEQ